MERQTVQIKKGKQTNGQAKVVCNWSYSKETTPGFARLLALLLRPREKQEEIGNGEKDEKCN